MLMLYWTYVPCYIGHTYHVILDIRTMLYRAYVPCYLGHTYHVILDIRTMLYWTYVPCYLDMHMFKYTGLTDICAGVLTQLIVHDNWVFLSELFTTFAKSEVLDIKNHYHDVFTFLSSLIKPLLVFVFLIY